MTNDRPQANEGESWEFVSQYRGALCDRLKVDGGWLYRTGTPETIAMSFVPDIDLQRYQSHLRDAYKQGYSAGYIDGHKERSPSLDEIQQDRSDIP